MAVLQNKHIWTLILGFHIVYVWHEIFFFFRIFFLLMIKNIQTTLWMPAIQKKMQQVSPWAIVCWLLSSQNNLPTLHSKYNPFPLWLISFSLGLALNVIFSQIPSSATLSKVTMSLSLLLHYIQFPFPFIILITMYNYMLMFSFF